MTATKKGKKKAPASAARARAGGRGAARRVPIELDVQSWTNVVLDALDTAAGRDQDWAAEEVAAEIRAQLPAAHARRAR